MNFDIHPEKPIEPSQNESVKQSKIDQATTGAISSKVKAKKDVADTTKRVQTQEMRPKKVATKSIQKSNTEAPAGEAKIRAKASTKRRKSDSHPKGGKALSSAQENLSTKSPIGSTFSENSDPVKLNPSIQNVTNIATAQVLTKSLQKTQKQLQTTQRLRKNNLAELNQLRCKHGKQITDGAMKADTVLQDLPKIADKVAQLGLQQMALKTKDQYIIAKTSIGEENTKKGKSYNVTVTASGHVFVHIPKSSFALGAEKEIKLAIDLSTNELIVCARQDAQQTKNKLVQAGGQANLKRVYHAEVMVKERCSNHPNILTSHIVTSMQAKKDHSQLANINLLIPFMPNGDLDDKSFKGPELMTHCISAANGLEKLHKENIGHRDMKPENMMIGADGILKIMDFGTAIDLSKLNHPSREEVTEFLENHNRLAEIKKEPLLTRDQATQALIDKNLVVITRLKSGTPHYSPLLNNVDLPFTDFEKNHTAEWVKSKDVYALGVSFLELKHEQTLDLKKIDVNKLPISDPRRKMDSTQIQIEFLKSLPDKDSMDELILRMLNPQPEKRPSAEEISLILGKIQSAQT